MTDTPTPDPLTIAWADLAEDIESPADDIVAAGATGEAFVTKHRPLIERAAHPAPDTGLRETRNQGYREGRLSVWLEIQEAANDGVKLARRIAKELDHAD